MEVQHYQYEDAHAKNQNAEKNIVSAIEQAWNVHKNASVLTVKMEKMELKTSFYVKCRLKWTLESFDLG